KQGIVRHPARVLSAMTVVGEFHVFGHSLGPEREQAPINRLAFRLAAAASTCFATPGAAASAGTSAPSPVCIAADLRLMTLIEAHSEAQDVATEVLAKAFFTLLQARRACDQGQVDAGIRLYESIPLGPVPEL